MNMDVFHLLKLVIQWGSETSYESNVKCFEPRDQVDPSFMRRILAIANKTVVPWSSFMLLPAYCCPLMSICCWPSIVSKRSSSRPNTLCLWFLTGAMIYLMLFFSSFDIFKMCLRAHLFTLSQTHYFFLESHGLYVYGYCYSLFPFSPLGYLGSMTSQQTLSMLSVLIVIFIDVTVSRFEQKWMLRTLNININVHINTDQRQLLHLSFCWCF